MQKTYLGSYGNLKVVSPLLVNQQDLFDGNVGWSGHAAVNGWLFQLPRSPVFKVPSRADGAIPTVADVLAAYYCAKYVAVSFEEFSRDKAFGMDQVMAKAKEMCGSIAKSHDITPKALMALLQVMSVELAMAPFGGRGSQEALDEAAKRGGIHELVRQSAYGDKN